jgi:hypothetical protein
MLIPVAPAKDESFYMIGEHLKVKVGENSSRFFAARRSLENPHKIQRKSQVFANWYLTPNRRKDIAPYHAALLHCSGSQVARIASAQSAAVDP